MACGGGLGFKPKSFAGNMVTRLTFANVNQPDWGRVELSPDWQAYRAFWTVVLQFATADGGSAVHYRLDAGEDCLGIEIDGKTYFMYPPPEQYRKPLLRAAKRLACDGWLKRLWLRVCRHPRLGSISLEYPGGDVIWQVHAVPSGVQISRLPDNVGVKP
jgi:hypothetical protein